MARTRGGARQRNEAVSSGVTSRLRERPLGQFVDLGECAGEGVDAREGSNRLRAKQVRDGPVVLPETDVPEEAAVGVEVEASPGTVRSREGESDLTDLPDAQAQSATNGLRCRLVDAGCIHFSTNPPTSGGPTGGGSRGLSDGPVDRVRHRLRTTRAAVGPPQGFGGRRSGGQPGSR